MSFRKRSALLLASAVVLLLAGYLLQKLEDAPTTPDVPDSELTPGTVGPTQLALTQIASERVATMSAEISAISRGTPIAASVDVPEGRNLSIDETQGGHTLARHVGKTDQELAARLKAEPDISAASSYFDRATAERSVATVLAKKASEIEKWERKTGSRANLALRLDLGTNVGQSLKRGQSKAIEVDSVVVVLAWRGDDWFVLTSYPEDR